MTTQRRRLSLTLALAAAIAATGASGLAQQPPPAPATPQEQPAPPVFRSAVDAVAVDVSVVDDQGRPVRGLKVDDFELTVDGQPRQINSADFVSQTAADGPPVSPFYSTNEGAAGGRLIMIVVDQGNTRQFAGARFIRAATRLLDNLGPGDRVGLAVMPGGVLVDFTNHFALVRARLERLTGGASRSMGRQAVQRVGLGEALAIERNDAHAFDAVIDRECNLIRNPEQMEACMNDIRLEATQAVEHMRVQTATSLTSLRQIMARLERVPRPKTLVLLTEGLVIDRRMADVGWVSAASAAARASLYAIVLDDTFGDMDLSLGRNSPSTGTDRQLRQEGIQALVGLARGATFDVVAGATSAFDRLSRELTGYYLLAFEPDPSERDGKAHEISVKVKRTGIEIRARREFTVAPPRTERRTDADALGEAIRDPLLATDRRMQVATYSFPDPGTNNVRVLISAGLGLGADELPIRAVAFRVVDNDGKVTSSRLDEAPARTDGDHRYLATVVVPAGTYALKIAGIDGEGKIGTVEHLFTAGLTGAGAFTAGDLMLSDDLPGASGLRPAIQPVIRAAGLLSYLELQTKDTALFAGATVRIEVATEANAPALASADAVIGPTKYPTRRIGEGRVAMMDLPPGDYVARAVVMLNGRQVGRLLREFRFDPGSAAIGGAASSFAPAVAAFDRAVVLRPEVVGPFVTRVESAAVAESESPAVQAAFAAAREGRLGELPDLLKSSATGGAATTFLRGLGLFARGDLEPAAAEFRKAIASGADDFVPGTFYLGACYAAGGRDSQAVGAWQTTLAVSPPSPAVFSVATDAYLRLEDWEAAADVAKEGLGAEPANDDLRLRMALALGMAGRFGEALDAFDGHLERHPADTEVLFQALRVLYRARATGATIAGKDDDQQRFDRYVRAYAAARGPNRALVDQWARAFAATDR